MVRYTHSLGVTQVVKDVVKLVWLTFDNNFPDFLCWKKPYKIDLFLFCPAFIRASYTKSAIPLTVSMKSYLNILVVNVW